MNWHNDNGEHVAKVGPFTLVASKSLETDRAPNKQWDARIWRNGITIIMACELRDEAEAKLAAGSILEKHINDERELFARAESALR